MWYTMRLYMYILLFDRSIEDLKRFKKWSFNNLEKRRILEISMSIWLDFLDFI